MTKSPPHAPIKAQSQSRSSQENALWERKQHALELVKNDKKPEALALLQQLLQEDPADVTGAAWAIAAINNEALPDAPSEAYIASTFDAFADTFDDHLQNKLNYDVPQKLRALFEDQKLGPFERGLDLGCGTGLVRKAFEGVAKHNTGIDLSQKMIEKAAEQGGYDELHHTELLAFLKKDHPNLWDIILAAEVFNYFSELSEVIEQTARNLQTNGLLVFTVESQPEPYMEGKPFIINAGLRVVHSERYVKAQLQRHGLNLLALRRTLLRLEGTGVAPGILIIAQKE